MLLGVLERKNTEVREALEAKDKLKTGRSDLLLYHPDGPEGQQVVVLLAVAPGVPARILSLLQDVHLTTEVHLLKAHEAAEETTCYEVSVQSLRETDT